MAKRTSEIPAKERPKLIQTHSISVSERESIDGKFYTGGFSKNAKTLRGARNREALKCEICRITYSSLKTLTRHTVYYGHPKYPCSKCGTKFADARQRKFHISYAHAEARILKNYKLKCPVCGQMAVSDRFLQSHLYHYHNEWAIKNYDTFVSERKTVRNEISSDINGRENGAENVISQRTPQGSPNRTSSLERRKKVSQVSTSISRPEIAHSSKNGDDIKAQRSLEMYGNSIKFDDSSDDVKTEAYAKDPEYSHPSNSDRESEIYSDEIQKALHSCKECYVPLERIQLEKSIPTDDFSASGTRVPEITIPEDDIPLSRVQLPKKPIAADNLRLSRIRTPEKTMATEDLLFSAIQVPDKSMANDNLPFFEIQIPDKSMTLENSQFLEIEILDKSMTTENSQFLEIQILDKSMTTEKSQFLEIQIPDKSMTTENSQFFENQVPEDPITTEISQFIENQVPEDPITTENSQFFKNQVPEDPITTKNSKFFENQLPEEPMVTENWSFLGIHVPEATPTPENQSVDTENVKSLKKIEETLRYEDNHLKFEAISSDEICLDEWAIKTEANEYTDSSAEISETPNASSSVFDATDIEVIANPTESADNDRNIVIASKICDKYFPSKRAMQRHFRQRHMIAHGDVVFCVCGKPMAGRTAKEQHFYQHCGKLLTSMDVINRPSETFTSCRSLDKTLECPTCGEKFWLETCLRDHQVRCRLAKIGNSKKRELTLKIHRQYRRQERNSAQYVCKECNSGYNTSKALSQHKQKYTNAESHQCPICKTIFTGRRLLKGHIQSTHESNRKHLYSVFCEICHQGFTKNLYKRIHIMHCHPIEGIDETEVIDVDEVSMFIPQKEKSVLTKKTSQKCPFPVKNSLKFDNKCKICNIDFVSRKRFIDHMIYYKKNEIVYCNICGKHFEGQYMAHNHNKKFHYAKDMQRSYTHYCDICKIGFMYKTHLIAHMSHVHEVALDSNNTPNGNNQIAPKANNYQSKVLQKSASLRYVCNICEIRFQSAVVLANHENKYSNDGEFACNQCPRKFRTTLTLLDHISINHSEEVVSGGVKCSRCNENLLTRTAWVSHVKHLHNSDGNEPSEFCFENNVSTAREFANMEIELIPTNESISSGTTYINFGNATNPTDRRDTSSSSSSGNIFEICSSEDNRSGKSSISFATIKEAMCAEKISTNCGTCGLVCAGSADLAKHMALYSNTGYYHCTICDRRFAWHIFCENHKIKHFRCDPNNYYFCPICDEGFGTFTAMKMHKAHFHQIFRDIEEINGLPSVGKRSVENRGIAAKNATDVEYREEPEVIDVEESLITGSPRSKERSAKCIICKAFFGNKKLLKIHENNFHSLVSIASAAEKNKKESYAVGNRFYVLAGIEILPEAVDVIQKNFEKYKTKLGLTDCIYRYGISYECDICRISFASNELLNDHRGKIHTVSSNDPIENGRPEKPNVYQGKIHMVSSKDSIENEKSEKPNVYRGKFCMVSSKDPIENSKSQKQNIHRGKVHTVSTKDPIENSKSEMQNVYRRIIPTISSKDLMPHAKPEKQNLMETFTVKKTAAKRSYGKVTKEVESLLSVSDSSSERNIEKPSTTAELSKKIVPVTFRRSILKPHISTDPEKQVKHYRCKICDIIFVTKSLLRVHQVNGQCLKSPIEQIDRETHADDEISVIESREFEDLTDKQRFSDRNSQSDCDIESFKISSPANELNARYAPIGKISNNDEYKTSSSPNGRSVSPSRMRLIKLPPGNYRIGKLKVRPFGSNTVQNLLNETGMKRKEEIGKNVAPPTKRSKKVFDPVTFRELCRQHNLVPATENRKEKSPAVPYEIVLH